MYDKEKTMCQSKLLVLILLLAVSLVVIPACSDEGEDEIVPASIDIVQAGDQIQLAFEEGGEAYRIIPLWTLDEDSSTGYTLTATEDKADSGDEGDDEAEDGEEPSSRLRLHQGFSQVKPVWMTESRYHRMLKRFAWDSKMRLREKEIFEQGLVTPDLFERRGLRAKKSEECGDLEVARGDECLSQLDLKFMDFDGNISDITVEIKGKGSTVAVAVDIEDSVTQSDIDEIVDRYDNVIYPRDHFLYGSPVIDSVDYTDRDQDGLHLIVLTHLVNDSGAVGLFNPNDFVPDALNDADILWVVVPDNDNPLDSVFGTVAHEYFHMIMFGVKRVKFQGDETLWLNESLAHLAEDSSGFGIDNIDTAKAYLDAVPDYSLAFSGDDVEARGMGFLFLRYLFEQQGAVEYDSESGSTLTDGGGASFLTSLIQTDEVGFDALNTSLGSDWKDHFFDWLAAVSLDGLDIANDPKYQYMDLYDDPISGQQIGICTNCTRTNAMGDDVLFEGLYCEPFEDEYDGVLYATGAGCVQVEGEGEVFIDTEAEEDGVQFGIVRIK